MDILALVSSLVDKKLGFSFLMIEEQSIQINQNNVGGISLNFIGNQAFQNSYDTNYRTELATNQEQNSSRNVNLQANQYIQNNQRQYNLHQNVQNHIQQVHNHQYVVQPTPSQVNEIHLHFDGRNAKDAAAIAIPIIQAIQAMSFSVNYIQIIRTKKCYLNPFQINKIWTPVCHSYLKITTHNKMTSKVI